MTETWVQVLIPLLISCVNVSPQHSFCKLLIMTPDPALSEYSPRVGPSYYTYDRLSLDYGGPPGPAGISLWMGQNIKTKHFRDTGQRPDFVIFPPVQIFRIPVIETWFSSSLVQKNSSPQLMRWAENYEQQQSAHVSQEQEAQAGSPDGPWQWVHTIPWRRQGFIF